MEVAENSHQPGHRNPGGRMKIPVVYYPIATACKANIIIYILLLGCWVHCALPEVSDSGRKYVG